MKCRDSVLGSVLVGTRTIPSMLEAQETRQESANVYETKLKINTAYCIAKEEMPFTRMKPLILLQKKNGLDISPTYDNDMRCAELVLTIAKDLQDCEASKVKVSFHFHYD